MKQKSDSSQWEGDWLVFNSTVLGRHSKLWLYPKDFTVKEIKSFIRLQLQRAKKEVRQDLKKKVERMSKKIIMSSVSPRNFDYNQAISDILKLLEE